MIPAVLLLLASCAQDDVTTLQKAQRLTVTVTDGGYASAPSSNSGAPATRVVENGYTTTFTAGDTCGLYVVRGTKTAYANVKLIATKDAATNALVWTPEAGTVLAGGLDDEHYYLYYPYQADMAGKTAEPADEALSDAEFFKPLIDSWQPASDQSTYAQYTASDLMTAKGTTAGSEGSVRRLSFYTTHRMALAVISMPKTIYKFTNERMTDYTVYNPVTFSSAACPLNMGDGTYRHLVNPVSTAAPTLNGSYADGYKSFSVTLSDLVAGSYKTYKVDGATVTTKSYTIQRGDFLLYDGNLLPKGTELTDAQKASVAAIIFWTPADTDTTGRVTPARLTDDKIMAADFPNCTHGLAVAPKDAGKVVWLERDLGNFIDSIVVFQNSRADLSPSTSNYKSVFSKYMKIPHPSWAFKSDATDPISYILGYQNTLVLRAFNAYCKANGKTEWILKPVEALDNFIATNPAPAGSTGWFFPSTKEVEMLFRKDVDDMHGFGGYNETKNLIAPSIYAVGGNLGTVFWWTSLFGIGVDDSGAPVAPYYVEHSLSVRAVCAF